MDNIGDIVQKVIHGIVEKKGDQDNDIDFVWKETISEKEGAHSRLEGFQKDTLIIFVDSPAWLHQFKIKKNSFIQEIQRKIPELKNIHFKIGKIK